MDNAYERQRAHMVEERTFENRHGGHPRAAQIDRARQFKPFAALRGYEQLVRERAQEVADADAERAGEFIPPA